jgi:hypothetical protein
MICVAMMSRVSGAESWHVLRHRKSNMILGSYVASSREAVKFRGGGGGVQLPPIEIIDQDGVASPSMYWGHVLGMGVYCSGVVRLSWVI